MDWNERQFNKGTGKALQSARRSAKKTQDDIAKIIGVNRTSVTNMEAGRQAISLYHAALIADVLPEFATRLMEYTVNKNVGLYSKVRELFSNLMKFQKSE